MGENGDVTRDDNDIHVEVHDFGIKNQWDMSIRAYRRENVYLNRV